jgi:transmembrane sensor
MSGRSFRRAIFDARSRLEQVRMPAAAVSRVRRNIERAQGHRRIQLALFGLAMAGAVSVMILHTPLRGGGAGPLPAGFETLSSSADLELAVGREGGTVDVRRGACTLRVEGWGRVSLQTGARFRRSGGGVELLSGAADFQVDKRVPGAGSTFVRGPQGSIEITGTRFSVVQRPEGGTVHLAEGGIRFHALDGRTVALVPGESLNWPLPALAPPADLHFPATPSVQAPAASSEINLSKGRLFEMEAPQVRRASLSRSDQSAESSDGAIVDRIAVLRAKGQYRELANELGVALLRERRPLTRERLSFELGSVLSYHLTDRERACAHWALHRRSFPDGHYAEEVSDAQQILKCNKQGETK